jgi:hypothetical protein
VLFDDKRAPLVDTIEVLLLLSQVQVPDAQDANHAPIATVAWLVVRTNGGADGCAAG